MKKILRYIRHSLSIRLSLWIVLLATIIFLGSLSYMFSVSRKAVRQEAIDHASQTLENTVLRVSNILDRVEVATNNTDWLTMRHLNTPDSMFAYSRNILKNNPDLYGCSIAFEPYYFKEKGRDFSAYSFRQSPDSIETEQEGNDLYRYFEMDWYLLPKLLDRPCWTEPYIDLDIDSTYTKEMIISYCKPLKDHQGRFIGVISTDISLNWLSQTISAMQPYPNSYNIMLGQGGTFLVHPDSTKLFYESIFTKTLKEPNPQITQLGKAMVAGEEGWRQMRLANKNYYVFYKSLPNTGWSVSILCPESDIFGGYNRLTKVVVAIMFFGLLLMFILFSRIVNSELKPLRQLTKGAETIASGQFGEELPDLGRIDEIGQLTHSFSNMQHSLVNYIDKLKTTTVAKERFESELRIARDIQMSMVPDVFPQHDGLDMYASMTPAKEVGGDLYDYVMQGGKLYFCVGDVSGKGVPASLFMAQSARLFRTLVAEDMMPVDIASRMNNALTENNDRGMFVTMFIGMLHLETGRLDFCNCGHNPPVIDGQFLELHYANQPLGLWEDDPFYGESIADIRGCQLLIYTDGLNEAENQRQEMLGNKRLIELMADATNLDSHQVIDMLVKEVEQHRAGADSNDDLTLMCLKLSNRKRQLTFKNEKQELIRVAEFMEGVCNEQHLDMHMAMKLQVAMEEMVTNVIFYAYPKGICADITLTAESDGKELTFVLSDTGKPFDPTTIKDADIEANPMDREQGGMGIHIMKNIMSEVIYQRLGDTNQLTMKKKL